MAENQAMLVAGRGPLDLFRGFGLAFRAIGLLFATRRLVLLTLSIAALTAVILAGLGVGLWHGAPALVNLAWARPQAWWAAAVHDLLTAAAFIVLFAIGANTLPLTLAAPLMDPVSVETERAIGVPLEDAGGLRRLVREISRAVANALLRMGVLALGHLLLLVFLVIPVVGGPLWSVLSWLWTAICLGLAYLDVPMARRLYSMDEEVAAFKRRFGLCVGFGAAISLMLWIPLLNFFFVPVAVIAATLLFRSLVASGDVAPPRG